MSSNRLDAEGLPINSAKGKSDFIETPKATHTNFERCSGLACGDECDGKSHATTERTCKRCGAPLLIKAVSRDPSKENEAAQDMVSACANCGTRDYDSDAWQGCRHNVPPWFTSASADKPIDPTLSGYPRTESPRPAAQDAVECPFCGTTSLRFVKNGDHNGYIKHPIVSGCPMSGRDVPLDDWNHRPSRPMSAEALRKSFEGETGDPVSRWDGVFDPDYVYWLENNMSYNPSLKPISDDVKADIENISTALGIILMLDEREDEVVNSAMQSLNKLKILLGGHA